MFENRVMEINNKIEINQREASDELRNSLINMSTK
jgi:hypothetical protein